MKDDKQIQRILFLDIDGVLNGSEYFHSFYRKILIKLFHYRCREPKLMLSNINLRYLKKLCRKFPDLKVVISSSWKKCWNRDGTVNKSFKETDLNDIRNKKIDKILRKRCKCNIVGTIPNHYNPIYPPLIDYSICDGLIKTTEKIGFTTSEETNFRGMSILGYLVENGDIFSFTKNPGELRYKYNIEKNYRIVILEDDYIDVSCFNDLKPHVVVTKFYGKKYGFRKEHYKKAVELLK